jgi:hypothetical protein
MAHPTEQVVQQVIHPWLPSLPPIRQRQLARWVLGAVLAGNANGPSVIQAFATAGVVRPTTLTDQWDAWLDQPAHQTTTPPAAAHQSPGAQSIVVLEKGRESYWGDLVF